MFHNPPKFKPKKKRRNNNGETHTPSAINMFRPPQTKHFVSVAQHCAIDRDIRYRSVHFGWTLHKWVLKAYEYMCLNYKQPYNTLFRGYVDYDHFAYVLYYAFEFMDQTKENNKKNVLIMANVMFNMWKQNNEHWASEKPWTKSRLYTETSPFYFDVFAFQSKGMQDYLFETLPHGFKYKFIVMAEFVYSMTSMLLEQH